MSDTPGELFDPDAPAVIKSGRRFPYTALGNWVLLVPTLSDRAVRIYALLRMRADNDTEKCHPAQDLLAEHLGLAKADSIPKAVRELVDIGAVEVQTVRTTKGRLNIYTVHEAPPKDYSGPVSLSDWKSVRDAQQ